MAPDESYSMLLLALLLVVVTQKQFSHWVLEILLKLTRPGATVALLALLAFVYTRGLHYTFLVLSLVTVFLLKDMWTAWPNSDKRRLELEIGRDQDRFDHSTSIDLQMADKTVTHAPPSLYAHDWSPKLLVFPPSAATQFEMNG
jgi:phosphoglycerol transferase MdoB-like AlkP superfamily enzyme